MKEKQRESKIIDATSYFHQHSPPSFSIAMQVLIERYRYTFKSAKMKQYTVL